MADYWVSQARKFCDFCKCWIADNKPSIQSHENGKRHKEAVAQRISQMTKQSVKEKKESLKIDEEMKKMEEAAMKAYLKDVESNPDYTSQVIKETVSEAKKMKETKNDENPHRTSISPPKNTPKERLSEKVSEKIYQGTSEKEKEWYEAQSDEGYTYYWNCNTGESIWEPPPEGYVSMEEQAKASKEVTNEEPEVEKQVETSEKEQSKANKRKIEVEKEEEEDEAQPNAGVGPSCKPDPYGRWKTVETRIQEPVDYQLPQQDFVEIKVPTVTEPEIKFKEKQITSIDDAAGPTTFKKRKFGARGNARQRFDDD